MTRIRHLGDELFTDIPPEFGAVQYNSLTVKLGSLPQELEAIAWSTNHGQNEILALKHRTKPLWGVQYHPEVNAQSRPNIFGKETRHRILQTTDIPRCLDSPSRAPTAPRCCPTSWPSLYDTTTIEILDHWTSRNPFRHMCWLCQPLIGRKRTPQYRRRRDGGSLRLRPRFTHGSNGALSSHNIPTANREKSLNTSFAPLVHWEKSGSIRRG